VQRALILNLAKGENFEVETLATQAVTELRAEFNILKLHAVRERRSSKDRLPWRRKPLTLGCDEAHIFSV
jgi:hypothetical protein